MRDAKTGLSFHYPEPTHGPGREFPYVTVADAIGDLPRVGVREEETRYSASPATPQGRRAAREKKFLAFWIIGMTKGSLRYLQSRFTSRRVPEPLPSFHRGEKPPSRWNRATRGSAAG